MIRPFCRLSFCPCHDPILGLEPASRRRRRPRLVGYCDPACRRLRHVRLRHARRRVFRLWRARGPDVGLRRRRDLRAARRQDADGLPPPRPAPLLHRVPPVPAPPPPHPPPPIPHPPP